MHYFWLSVFLKIDLLFSNQTRQFPRWLISMTQNTILNSISNKSCPPYRPFRYLISHDFDDFSDWMCFKNELKNLIKLNQKDVPAFVCQNQMCFSHISKLKLQSWCSFHTDPQRELNYLKLRTGCFIIFQWKFCPKMK